MGIRNTYWNTISQLPFPNLMKFTLDTRFGPRTVILKLVLQKRKAFVRLKINTKFGHQTHFPANFGIFSATSEKLYTSLSQYLLPLKNK